MPRSDAVANLRRALTGACLKRSLGAMLLVGTVLNLINQWDFYLGAAEMDPHAPHLLRAVLCVHLWRVLGIPE